MTYRNKALLDLARGQECQARIGLVCNYRTDTTVSAHKNGGGMGTKHSDWRIAWCCSACHDFIDGRTFPNDSQETRDAYWRMAHERTLDAMFNLGLIQVTGAAHKREKGYQRPSKVLPRNAA